MLGLPHTEDQTLRIRKPRQECFNCLSISHRVSECPVRIDQKRCDLHRNYYHSQTQQAQGQSQLFANRYTSDLNANSYRGFRPGRISDELRDALGISSNQLPPFVYIMRKLGYPTAWLVEAQVKDAQLIGLDEEGNTELGKDNSEKKSGFYFSETIFRFDFVLFSTHLITDLNILEIVEYDAEKIFSFAGFNEPLPPGIIDVYNIFHCKYITLQVKLSLSLN